MQATLERFLTALRAAEVPVSVREGIEAHRVAALVGPGDRAALKDALAVTLAKSEDEDARFERCFELFFAADAAAPLDIGAGPGTAEQPVDAAELPPLARDLLAGDLAGLGAAMAAAAGEVGLERIRYASQRGLFARRLLEAMGLREIEEATFALGRAGDPAATGTAAALEGGRRWLLEEARRLVQRQQALYAAPNAERLREYFLSQTRLTQPLDRRDLARMHRIVRRMAKRLAARHARRRRVAKRGRLDVRRTLRRSMAHDGLPFELVWKRKKIERPRIVAICDVSRSVSAAARFLLLFLYSLNELVSEIRAFAFSDRLVEVSGTLDEHALEAAIDEVLRRIGFRPTDYGQALADFHDGFLDAVDRHTTVIVMGDGRSNYSEPRPELLRALHDRARRLIWLNPEPRTFWGLGDSEMASYAPHCHLARTCNTMAHLERVVDDLLEAAIRHG